MKFAIVLTTITILFLKSAPVKRKCYQLWAALIWV